MLMKLAALFQARSNDALALACLKQAARLDPADALPHFLIGRHHLLKRDTVRAAESFHAALRLRPDYAEAHNNLGVALYEGGELEQAADCYQSALRSKPDYVAAHNNLGNVRLSQGRVSDAEASFRQALRLDPGYAEAHNNLGLALKKQARYPEAEESLREALRIRPAFAGALSNLGSTFQDQGRSEDAAKAYEEALKLQPDLGEAHANLSVLLGDMGALAHAAEHFAHELRRNPDSPEAHNRLGAALLAQSRREEASLHFEEALRLRPDYADALANLANKHIFSGNVSQGLEAYRKAFSLGPNPDAHSSYMFCLHYSPEHEPVQIAAEYREWARLYAPPEAPAVFNNSLDPDRKLRIGYLSPDFRQHAVAHFIEPVIRHHDRSRFEVFCYANVTKPDTITEHLRSLSDSWRDIRLKSTDEIRAGIRADGIDILVDLAGHTTGSRVPVFALRSAPVQVTYLGHPNTTGLASMDYRITDAHADPPGTTEAFHTEQLIRLPRCFLAYAPPPDAPPVASPPCLEKGHVTFGSFNNGAKINPRVIAAWSNILRALPGSRLILKNFALSTPASKAFFSGLFAREGIGAERLDLFDFIPEISNHLQLYREIDIALDTFPYNGTTTTCDALWMGVPVIALAGNAHVSRVGVSLLTPLGLTTLIARDIRDYVGIAIELATDSARLAGLRTSMRERMKSSPLTDGADLARALENAYRDMWQRWVETRASPVASGAASMVAS